MAGTFEMLVSVADGDDDDDGGVLADLAGETEDRLLWNKGRQSLCNEKLALLLFSLSIDGIDGHSSEYSAVLAPIV